MYYYFSAKFPAVLKIDGIYHGEIDQKLKKIELLSNDSFIEVCPLELSQFPFSFILNQKFLFAPPNGVSVVDLKGGYLIEFNFLQDNSPFTILSQEKFSHAIVTVFKENGLKVSIETPNNFFAETVPFYCKSASITCFSLANKRFVAICFSGNNTLLNCYLLEGKIQKMFSKNVCDFSFENGFSTTEDFLDIAKHKLTCSWRFEMDKLVKGQTSLSTKENFCIDNLPTHIVGYAFLEELLCGGDITDYLADNIKENQNYLTEYFGEFLGIMPPPDFRDFNEIGLIYKCSENKYKVEYFKFELQSKRICNIIKAN